MWKRVDTLGDGVPASLLFGRDGREEAEDLLNRRSGLDDSPRLWKLSTSPVRIG